MAREYDSDASQDLDDKDEYRGRSGRLKMTELEKSEAANSALMLENESLRRKLARRDAKIDELKQELKHASRKRQRSSSPLVSKRARQSAREPPPRTPPPKMSVPPDAFSGFQIAARAPKRFDNPNWSNEDEVILQEMKTNDMKLWRTAIQRYQLLPPDLLPAAMTVDHSRNKDITRTRNRDPIHNTNWSESFCKNLATLTFCPRFKAAPDFIPYAIELAAWHRNGMAKGRQMPRIPRSANRDLQRLPDEMEFLSNLEEFVKPRGSDTKVDGIILGDVAAVIKCWDSWATEKLSEDYTTKSIQSNYHADLGWTGTYPQIPEEDIKDMKALWLLSGGAEFDSEDIVERYSEMPKVPRDRILNEIELNDQEDEYLPGGFARAISSDSHPLSKGGRAQPKQAASINVPSRFPAQAKTQSTNSQGSQSSQGRASNLGNSWPGNASSSWVRTSAISRRREVPESQEPSPPKPRQQQPQQDASISPQIFGVSILDLPQVNWWDVINDAPIFRAGQLEDESLDNAFSFERTPCASFGAHALQLDIGTLWSQNTWTSIYPQTIYGNPSDVARWLKREFYGTR